MSTVKLTREEQINLQIQAKNELERLEEIQNNQEYIRVLDNFKNKFNLCETAYKIILREHQKRKGVADTEFLKISMTQAPFALSFAGYNIDKALLNELFGAKSYRGKTVKKLRDAVTHGMEQRAVNEILARQEELFDYMDRFLNIIKNVDEVAA